MFDLFKNISDLYTSPHELAAIWLNHAVATNEGLKVRIAPGMQLQIENDRISLNAETFNKVIVTCYGTSIDQFKIKVRDINTGIESIIAL